MSPLISVIVPNYNHGKFLEERLISIFDQTYQDFEVIILDDCSTDNSRKVIEKYQNNLRVSHVIINEVNSGSTFKQWQKGLNLAKGDWIWIAESDDIADVTFLECCMKEIEDEVLIFCLSKVIDTAGKSASYFGVDHFPNNKFFNNKSIKIDSEINVNSFLTNEIVL